MPKILWLSAVEIYLVSLSGLNIPANIVSSLTSLGEIILGGSIMLFRQFIIPAYIAVAALGLLLLFVGLSIPEYLVGAFNPVTTNILGLGFCYLIWFTEK